MELKNNIDMKKTIVLLVTLIAVLSCKTDKKEENKKTEIMQEVEKPKHSLVDKIHEKYKFKKVENLLENPGLVNLRLESHAFSDQITFEDVSVLKTAEDTYSVLLTVSKDNTDLDELIKWTVAIVATPKDPKQFEDLSERKKGARTIGIYNKPEIMGDEIVIHLKDFKIKPKEFSFIRFYLYNKEDKNINYLVIKDANFPK